jgi:ribosomal protein S18 acetylase RimI-like enzyme
LEPTFSAVLRSSAAQPDPRSFGLGLAAATPITASVQRGPLPGSQRNFRSASSCRFLPWEEAAWAHLVMPAVAPPAPVPMMRIVRAGPEDLDTVLGLIDDASRWLRTKPTDQWTRPWPNREERDARVLAGLTNGKTWIVRDGDIAAATVTLATRANPDVWVKGHYDCNIAERAAYVHRLITSRKYAGLGLGAKMVDWAGRQARSDYGARQIRIDVWTSNEGLHGFYRKIGFVRVGTCPDERYPSGALFQKEVSAQTRSQPLFE